MAIWNTKSSILDVKSQTPSEEFGEVIINNDTISLGKDSYVIYTYDYGATGDILQTTAFKIESLVKTSDKKLQSRYRSYIYIDFKILYWAADVTSESGYSDGNIYRQVIYPYIQSEKKPRIDDIIIQSQNYFIRQIDIKIGCKDIGEASVEFSGLNVYNEISVEQAIASGGGGGHAKSAQFENIDIYDNGVVVKYYGIEELTTIGVSKINNTNTYRLNVSDIYNGFITLRSGEMPYSENKEDNDGQ